MNGSMKNKAVFFSIRLLAYGGIFSHNAALHRRQPVLSCFMVSLVGSLAMIGYELRQAWKGATVVADSCAGVWLTRAATQTESFD